MLGMPNALPRQEQTLYFFFPPDGLPPEAFFEAFNGSTVPPPPNPRRSRGGALDFEIITYPSRGPGIAPSTINRFSSRSIPRMRRLRTVTSFAPMWPGMRCPGNTRDGNEDAPIEPCT